MLGIAALTGLIASFHTILYAQGRQIYSLSRAGYFPTALSITHATHKTPHVAMIVGSIVGLAIMFVDLVRPGRGDGRRDDRQRAAEHGGVRRDVLLHPAGDIVHPAAANKPNIERPYVSPLGIPGAVVTIIIGVVTLLYQVQDPNFFKGVFWVLVWFAVGILYFALVGRHKLILSPEEEFALEHTGRRAQDGPREVELLTQGPAVSRSPAPSVWRRAYMHGRKPDFR